MIGYRKKGSSKENHEKQWKKAQQKRDIEKAAACRSKHEIGTKAYKKCMTGGDPAAGKKPIKRKPFEHIDEEAFRGQLDDKG
jgi:hypothetical protein